MYERHDDCYVGLTCPARSAVDMETEQQEDRMSVSLAWKDFFGKFSNLDLVAGFLMVKLKNRIGTTRPGRFLQN